MYAENHDGGSTKYKGFCFDFIFILNIFVVFYDKPRIALSKMFNYILTFDTHIFRVDFYCILSRIFMKFLQKYLRKIFLCFCSHSQ